MKTFFSSVKAWHKSDLKSAAVEIQLQRRKLASQLESQLARQEAWDQCEDDALRSANLEERELVLKAESAQLKLMRTNWLWFTKMHKLERTIKRLGEINYGIEQEHYRTMFAKA